MALDAVVEEQELAFVEICGVKVDVRISSPVQQFFRQQWEKWQWGAIEGMTIPDYDEQGREITEERREDYKRAHKGIYLTRYEHLALGKPFYFYLAPDPFLPLAAQAEKVYRDRAPNFWTKKTPLEEIIEERRKYFPVDELILCPVNTLFFPEFYARSKFPYGEYLLEFERPDISREGRVHIPRVIGVYKKNQNDSGKPEPFRVSDALLEKLQFPTTMVITQSGIKIREVFDYQNGYRIELAK